MFWLRYTLYPQRLRRVNFHVAIHAINFYVVCMAINFYVACGTHFVPFCSLQGCIVKHRRLIIPSAPGRVLAPPMIVGCSWCHSQIEPLITSELVDGVTRYAGGICDQCVQVFHDLLCCSRWQKLRRQRFAVEPYCRYCFTGVHDAPMPPVDHLTGVCRYSTKDTLTPATVIDHILPWRYFPSMYWDANNLQSLCKLCHDDKTQLERIDPASSSRLRRSYGTIPSPLSM